MADDDLRLGISAVDRGAARLVRGVADALRALSSVQAQQATATQKTAAAARSAADSLAFQSRLAHAAVADEKARLQATVQASNARIAILRAEREEAVKSAQTIARAQNEVAKGFAAQARERVKEAQALATVRIGSNRPIQFESAQIAARKRELREANENVARAAALGRQQIANARQVGVEEEKAARRQVQAQKSVLLAKQQTARESLRAANQSERDARVQERAALRAESAFRKQAATMGTINRTAQSLRNTILRLVAAYSGFRAIEGFIGAGLRFNQVIESSRLGIGGLITATAELFDSQGKLITGTDALAAAQSLAEDQLTKLRIAGIQTAATTEDLVTSFEEAVGAGLAVGLTLDQIRRFSVSVAQAASAIHLPMNQLQQETRSILQGTIDRNSRIAKALQLTNEQVRLAKEQGRLAELLEEKFKAFNIAGAESVKTFGALRSNIADAFSVFTGISTLPLFEQLRDAGVKALQEIFDFRSADIAASFRGLIEGLQIIFKEIGALFADSIRGAVDRAKSLSEWLRRNREEVKLTAQALRTMVEDFGKLITSVVSAIGFFGQLAGSINPVIGLARILSAIFQSIADNVVKIIALLTARTLVTTIGAIATVVRGLATGAAFGSLVPGIGTAIGGGIGLILGLSTAYKLLRGDQHAASLEISRMSTAMQDQNQRAAELFGTISSLDRQIKEKGKSAEELAGLEAQLAAALEQVTGLGGKYAEAVKGQREELDKKKQALFELIKVQDFQTQTELIQAQAELRRLRRDADAARARLPTGPGFAAMPAFTQAQRTAIADADAALAAQEAKVETLRQAVLRLREAITKALETPATIRHRGTSTTDTLNKDINDAVQRAKADLDRVREINEAMRAGIQADLKAGVITAIKQIELERDLALDELDAEEKVARAQLDAARRRIVGKKVVPDQGAIDAAVITLNKINKLRELTFQESQDRTDAVLREHIDKRAKIEEDFERASGRRLKAAQLEIRRKHQADLREAIREFGADAPEVIKIRFVIEQETIREQVDALEEELRRIVQLRDAQVANARAALETGVGGRGRGGRLTTQQQQTLADQIAAANARAVVSTEQLKQQLQTLRAQATDELTQTFIDKLLLQIDTLKQKSKEVDLELKRLTDGIQEAFTGGLADFLDNLTDKTKTFAQSFHQMVVDILQDISRLVSRLIAEKIVFALLGVTPAAGGGRAGNLTQSEGRAAGGLGRPKHGLLHGGFPGVDSIHISAMPDEYFTQSKAVRHYGVELFDALNNMELPRINPRTFRPLAFGGGPEGSAGVTARPSQRQEVHHTFAFDDDGLVRVMRGRFGKDIVIGHVSKNPRTLSAALSRGRPR